MLKFLYHYWRLKSLSLAELQVFSARCLERFFEEKKICSVHVSALVDHLKNIPNDMDKAFVEWEKEGSMLEFSGREDEFPDALRKLIPDDLMQDSENMVEFAVEVGLTDAYGARTIDPLLFSIRCARILESQGISVPRIEE